jgi:hypothetical protein
MDMLRLGSILGARVIVKADMFAKADWDYLHRRQIGGFIPVSEDASSLYRRRALPRDGRE